MKVAIYTAVFGGYDSIKPQVKQTIETDFFCFTDQEITHPDWNVVSIPAEGNARKQAKWFKLMPHHVSQLNGYDFAIWIDGSFEIKRPDFVEWVLSFIKESGWAVFRHNQTSCIYDEADAMAKVIKYHGSPINEQAAYYKEQGYPAQNGLYFCGLIARDMSRGVWKSVCSAWWSENDRWTLRDQISLPYVLWKEKATIDIIEGNLFKQPYFSVDNDHRKHEYNQVSK